MGFSARVILDSVSGAGARLTTMEARYPRFIHSEVMTHRVFCLDGDTELYFDLPTRQGDTKRFTMTIAEFHEKWHEGAKPRLSKPRVMPVDPVEPNRLYTAQEAAALLGYHSHTVIDGIARRTGMARTPGPDGRHRYKGSELLGYARAPRIVHRYSLRGRLRRMNLRSCDEDTRAIHHTHVGDVTFSGYLPAYRVTTEDGKSIVTTSEHRFLTPAGWRTLREAAALSLTVNGLATWNGDAQVAVNGVEALESAEWLQEMRDKGYSARAIADELGVSIDRVKHRFRRFKIRVSNPTEVWHRSHTKPPWNKGRKYSNLKMRGRPGSARIKRGSESHLWRGGVTPERYLIGQWTQMQAFRVHQKNSFRCTLCGSGRDLHAHHIDPVAHNPSRAYDIDNLASVCRTCHGALHHRNLEIKLLEHVKSGGELGAFWATIGDLRLHAPYRPKKKRAMVAHFVNIIAIEYVGMRPTYDLEVTGPFHNFVANGFVVHNSRNAASSRAIPIRKMIEAVRDEPAMPRWWGRNQSGMQAFEQLEEEARAKALHEWKLALDDALAHAERLARKDIDLHKQLVNRLLEPFAWITVIITATEWANFFTQRCHPDAQPEIKHIAELMLAAYRASTPVLIPDGHWHLPLIQDDERTLPEDVLCKLSVARCARVSYLTHEGRRDHDKDFELYERLLGGGANGHWSPFEHVATPLADPQAHSGNFRGWEQYRKRFSDENAVTFPDAYSAAER
jgi:thymidylate synthase ThyX/5-methylcytosine-specific restriction endonuclease McrA